MNNYDNQTCRCKDNCKEQADAYSVEYKIPININCLFKKNITSDNENILKLKPETEKRKSGFIGVNF